MAANLSAITPSCIGTRTTADRGCVGRSQTPSSSTQDSKRAFLVNVSVVFACSPNARTSGQFRVNDSSCQLPIGIPKGEVQPEEGKSLNDTYGDGMLPAIMVLPLTGDPNSVSPLKNAFRHTSEHHKWWKRGKNINALRKEQRKTV